LLPTLHEFIVFRLEFLKDFDTMIEKGRRRLQLAIPSVHRDPLASGQYATPLEETQMSRLVLPSSPWPL
jgi:hypothetical protein